VLQRNQESMDGRRVHKPSATPILVLAATQVPPAAAVWWAPPSRVRPQCRMSRAILISGDLRILRDGIAYVGLVPRPYVSLPGKAP
jgi:hypothetical protein